MGALQNKTRLEAFSDGVLAIIITIMVLEIHAPKGASLSALIHEVPHLLCYLLSFVFVGIYWNNHHHLIHFARQMSPGVLWGNLHLLFWLSLVPLATQWLGENPTEAFPAAVYAALLLTCGLAYKILQSVILSQHERDDEIKATIGSDRKGYLSLGCYTAAVPAAFVSTSITIALCVIVALLWIIPDRRLSKIH
jgi:uncharacterized membrane protein